MEAISAPHELYPPPHHDDIANSPPTFNMITLTLPQVRGGDMTLSDALAMLKFDQDQGELPSDNAVATSAADGGGGGGGGSGGGGGGADRGEQRQKTLLLLTDGQPNISPPQV